MKKHWFTEKLNQVFASEKNFYFSDKMIAVTE